MANYIKKIRTVDGDKQIDYEALANKPDLTKFATKTDLSNAVLADVDLYLHRIRLLAIDANDKLYIDFDLLLPFANPIDDSIDNFPLSCMPPSPYMSWKAFLRAQLEDKQHTVWGHGKYQKAGTMTVSTICGFKAAPSTSTTATVYIEDDDTLWNNDNNDILPVETSIKNAVCVYKSLFVTRMNGEFVYSI